MLQDEENGAWYQHRGRDFEVLVMDYLCKYDKTVGAKEGFELWPGCLNHHV